MWSDIDDEAVSIIEPVPFTDSEPSCMTDTVEVELHLDATEPPLSLSF